MDIHTVIAHVETQSLVWSLRPENGCISHPGGRNRMRNDSKTPLGQEARSRGVARALTIY